MWYLNPIELTQRLLSGIGTVVVGGTVDEATRYVAPTIMTKVDQGS